MKPENEWYRCPKCKGDMARNPYDKQYKCVDCGHVAQSIVDFFSVEEKKVITE